MIVVDDDDDCVRMLVESFAQGGLAASGFTSAGAALAAIRRSPPDVVVTDLGMTPIDGITLAREARLIAPAVAVIALSGVVDPEWEVMRWFDAYLRKPVDLQLAASVVGELGRVSKRQGT